MARYYEDARRLAFMVSTWTQTLKGRRHRFVVTSGGGPGIMEAGPTGGCVRGGRGKSIGLNIRLPFEQCPNPYITPLTQLCEFHYFFMRKYWFAYLAESAGGFPLAAFGTLDEMFELLTLIQTARKLAKKISIVVYGSSYWKSILNLDVLVEKGAISPHDRLLFQFADTPEEAFALLQADLIRNHLEPEARRQAQPQVEEEALQNPDITGTR